MIYHQRCIVATVGQLHSIIQNSQLLKVFRLDVQILVY